MKKMILLGFFVLFIPAMVYGQDKVDAPVWNIGDKWILGGTVTIMVGNADQSTYTVKYSTPGGESALVYEKSSLNRLYSVEKDRQVPYEGRNKRLLNFPLEIGKSWKDKYDNYFEVFTVLGWEEIKVPAGKYKALKLEYRQGKGEEKAGRKSKEGKAWYWYSPDVKYMIKCLYERSGYWDAYYDWELTSFELKK